MRSLPSSDDTMLRSPVLSSVGKRIACLIRTRSSLASISDDADLYRRRSRSTDQPLSWLVPLPLDRQIQRQIPAAQPASGM